MSKVATELLKLSPEDLKQKVVELKKDIVEQKRALAAGELANPHAVKKTRREIAIALTLLNQPRDEAAKKEEA